MRARAIVAGLLVAACCGSSAQAAGWKRVTTGDGASSDQVGILRTGDRVLHVAWHHRTGPNTEDLLHTVISPAGTLGPTNPIQSGWASFTNPALVADPGGIRAFWGGIRTTDPSEVHREISTAVSADRGASWALQPGTVVATGTQSYASPVAATVRSDGTTLQSWAGTLGTWVHAGLTPATPNHDYQGPLGTYGFDPALATDANNRTVMAWYSNATARRGVLAQDVAANGSPVGSAATMPGTGAMGIGMIGRTPLVARSGGGFYVAYPTGSPLANRIRIWRVGAATAPVIARVSGRGNQPVTLAAAADGRLWVAWVRNSAGKPRVFARRSNESATVFGATVDAGRVANSAAAYQLDASAVGGKLDLLANFSLGTTSATATYHQRVLPGLTLRARPAVLGRGDTRRITFTVRDAGSAVRGARVGAAGRSATTNGAGRVVLSLKGIGRAITATATRVGYEKAERRLRVR